MFWLARHETKKSNAQGLELVVFILHFVGTKVFHEGFEIGPSAPFLVVLDLGIQNDGAEVLGLSMQFGLTHYSALLVVGGGCANSLPPTWRDQRVLHRATSSFGGCNLPRGRNRIAKKLPERADCVEDEPKRFEDESESQQSQFKKYPNIPTKYPKMKPIIVRVVLKRNRAARMSMLAQKSTPNQRSAQSKKGHCRDHPL
jgi:hypothetical protein